MFALLCLSDGANAFGQLGEYVDTDPLYIDIERSDRTTRTEAFILPSAILSQEGNIRSRSDVISEVKQRYNAEVLRIKLNEKRMVYEVRVLMPNGKVKNITVSARR